MIDQVNAHEQQRPKQAPPIENQPAPGQFADPGPAPIFQAILPNRRECALVIGQIDDQAPARVLLGPLDARIDALAVTSRSSNAATSALDSM